MDSAPTMTSKDSTFRLLTIWAWKIIRIPFFAYMGLILVLCLFENRLVFQPTTESGKPPSRQSPNVRHQFVRSKDHSIHLLIVERDDPRLYALYFHGNGGNITHRASMLQRLATELNITIIGVSYSGYGYSEGAPDEDQLAIDSEAAYSYLRAEYDASPSQIMVFGESLGGAIATRLAAKHALPLLALDSTFSSITDVAQHHYRWLPIRILMKNRFPTSAYAKKFNGTTIQTHGTDDQIVPFHLGDKLANQFAGSHEMIIRENGKHNEVPPDEYYRAIAAAIDRISNDGPASSVKD